MKITMRILYVFLLWSVIIYAQSSPVSILTAPTGSTLANCGTPTVPAICVVIPGVYVWQNAAIGWVLIGATNAVQKVQGVAPGATGNVSVSCTAALQSSTAAFTSGTTTSATVPAATLPVTCTGSGS
jgi:hypothetical protein